MIVGMWMTRELVTIGPAAPAADAAALMLRHRIRRLPVVGPSATTQAALAGVVTARELERAFSSTTNPFAVNAARDEGASTPVRLIMRRDVPVASPEMPIEEAATIMRQKKIGELPVLRDGELVGLITESDILGAFVDVFTVTGQGARITFDLSQGEDVFDLIGPLARARGVRVVTLITAHEHGRPVCVLRLAGSNVERLLDDIWASGHRVLNVLRFPRA